MVAGGWRWMRCGWRCTYIPSRGHRAAALLHSNEQGQRDRVMRTVDGLGAWAAEVFDLIMRRRSWIWDLYSQACWWIGGMQAQ